MLFKVTRSRGWIAITVATFVLGAGASARNEARESADVPTRRKYAL
jgi:hypothetical protein